MRYYALVFIALIVMSGCESDPKTSGPKTLDWDKCSAYAYLDHNFAKLR